MGRAKTTANTRLSVDDWIQAGFAILAEEGIKALKIDRLCSRLSVTKGSFYWHFAGRSELLAAALSRWEQRATAENIRGLNAIPDPRQRLALMLAAASEPPRARSLYAALAEAAEDPVVGAVLNRVATMRIAYLEQCYRELQIAPAAAKSLAVLAYAAYRGLLQLAHEAPAALPDDWELYARISRDALLPEPEPKD